MSVVGLHNETEIIEFQKPNESVKNLYVCNITVGMEEDEASSFVQDELHKAFSKFGLLHGVLTFIGDVNVTKREWVTLSSPGITHIANDSLVAKEGYAPTSHAPICRLYAFVKFYSKLCARRAKEHLHLTKIVGTTSCKIQFSQSKKSASKQKETLYPNDCVNMANFYLGFDGWSTSIKLMKRDDASMTDASNPQQMCRFLCVVELTIPKHGLSTHGIGTAEENLSTGMSKKGEALSKCRKVAHREALRDAFSRVLLVVVNGNAVGGGGDLSGRSSSSTVGKVHAEINTTIPDPFVTAECLKDPTMLTVNELLEEPREESSDEGDDADNDIDEKMIQILADLQSENSQFASPDVS